VVLRACDGLSVGIDEVVGVADQFDVEKPRHVGMFALEPTFIHGEREAFLLPRGFARGFAPGFEHGIERARLHAIAWARFDAANAGAMSGRTSFRAISSARRTFAVSRMLSNCRRPRSNRGSIGGIIKGSLFVIF
jgi:hypothetical protein